MHVKLNLFHPESEGALPRVLLLQVQVGVEEDEVNVSLQVLQAPQQQLLTLAVRLATFDLNREGGGGRNLSDVLRTMGLGEELGSATCRTIEKQQLW